MQKYVWLLCLAASLCAKENDSALQYTGVKVKLDHNRTVIVERQQPAHCLDIPVIPEVVFGQSEGKKRRDCTRTLYTSLGIVQPMQLDPAIETVGELEVLAFIKKAQKFPQSYIVVDARKRAWYRYMTLPTAVNIPYNEIAYDADFPQEHQRLCTLLNIDKSGDRYNFDNAKTVLLFCNGAWCAQSSKAIHTLVELGYPKEKLLWYRGGMQDWLLMGFKGIKP